MGTTLLDEYSLLHFAVGVVARHWAVGFWLFLIAHTIFEFAENTVPGMRFINTYLKLWPGGKSAPDNLLNQFGDTVAGVAGWAAADLLLQLRPRF